MFTPNVYDAQEYLSARHADSLAEMLSDRHVDTHAFTITFDYANQLGLYVSSDIPPQVWDLMALCPQPVRRYDSRIFAEQARCWMKD
jgi:hypothetical protein